MAVETRRPILSREQIDRYSRQLILDEIGVAGQRRLLDSKVLVVGAGGLGSPSALYLAAAGVGTIGIIDGDRVELNNLHRQVIHRTADVGVPKTESAKRTLEALNPDVTVVPYQTTLTAENALEIIGSYDLVVNGSDNFPTRYLVNDACVFLRKPLVDASILRWEGQATTFLPGRGCYRCLFPTPPPPGTVPSCAEGGILGALAGFMGTLQAAEAVKVLLGVGETLGNRLFIFDALAMDFRLLRWARNPDCPVCGDRPTITALIDYEAFCGLPGRHAVAETDGEVPEVEPAEAVRLLEAGAQLIDVREPWEWAQARIPGAVLIPKGEVRQRLTEIDPNRPVVVHCASGARSADVVKVLRAAGYGNARNLRGGIIAWFNERLPVETAAERES
ncbi:MAG: molybdopterin-synthase adenylyltransferase MoeB [Armatimonadota bacterium]|nr:molybdopterin-synthase adenylyltransferase MoeB [Armatimonadota bacterium]MDR7479532.1 molybdopterin-synthase adenylyltransferase MoeB [Armatimonadota bacterium]MDR7489068.1 molybdopterin-synthase adenylyltransferase MoeB [Armatimonadota bacterium]MDR7490505.1 molybdopterin-synthase adenylyltransferase MoeB [Armatimonadota bacterium]MDR7502375.1 molybdopterin-synthase adenylyltransferase MoeB [Armatimonadota bacterium]